MCGAIHAVTVGSEADAKAAFDSKIPFYNAAAKTYIVAYPKADLPKAKKVYNSLIYDGMAKGYVALYQYDPATDTGLVLAVRHQREAGFGEG